MPRPDRPPGVNYFFGVRLTNPDILSNIESFQQEYASANEELLKDIEAPSKAHITINVLYLKEEEVEPCADLIREKLSLSLTDEERTLKIQGVDKFGSRVVWAKPIGGVEFLEKLRRELFRILLEGKFDVREVDRKFEPHVTMFKTQFRGSRSNRRKSGEEKKKRLGDDIDLYSDTLFGEDIIKEFQLLSMNKPLKDGYYHSEATFSLG